MERLSDMNKNKDPNDPQKKTASGKKSPYCCAVMSNLKKHLPTIKIGRSGATVGLVMLEDKIRKRTAGPSEKNTGKEELLPKSKDPIGISPNKAKTSEEHANNQVRTISGKPQEPKKHRFSKLAPKDLGKKKCLDKRKVRGKTTMDEPVEKENFTPQVRNVSVDGKSSKDGQKKNLDVHASDEDVKPAIGNCSAANSSSAVSDVVTSTSHKSDLEQRIAREIHARIAKAVSHAVKLDTPESEVQTKVPVKNHQKEPTSNAGFDQCIAALIGSMLMESKEKIIEQLNSKPDKFPTASNNATEKVEDVFKSIVDSVFNGNTLNPGESTASETNALVSHSLKRACKRILKSICLNNRESHELKDGQMGKDETSFLNTITKEDKDIVDADHKLIGRQEHASPVPSPPATKKPDSIRGSARRTTCPTKRGNTSSERLSIVRPHSNKRKVPSVRLDEKEHCSSRGHKPCDFPRSIGVGAMSPEATGDLNFLFRPAPGAPPPLPRRCFVGEVGWGIEHGFKFGSKDLRSGHQIKRSGFRLEMEDRLSQILPDPWQAPAHSLDREAECPGGLKCLKKPAQR